jgi:hypothetical protein
MLCVARASREALVAEADGASPAAGARAGTAAAEPLAGAWLPANEELGELAEQPASSSAALDISAAQESVVVRSGPRMRTLGVVFMPLGRAQLATGSARNATVR